MVIPVAAKMTLYDYLAHGEESTKHAVASLMRGRNYIINPRNEDELADCIAQFVNHESNLGNYDGAMQVLASIHPDRDLILATAPAATKMNADGLGGSATDMDTAAAKHYPGVQVNLSDTTGANNSNTSTVHIIVGGLIGAAFLLGVAIIAIKS